MKNPNAVAAVVSTAVTTGVQWLVGHYAGRTLPLYWSNILTGSVASLLLLIGRDGVVGAAKRGIAFLRYGVTGASSAAK